MGKPAKIESHILGLVQVAWRGLEWFQPDDFKKSDEALAEKLARSLLASGLVTPFHVWRRGAGRYMILDGHLRQRAMMKLAESGVSIPDKLPALLINIKNESQAKRAVLVYNSHYARVDKKSALAWIDGLDVNVLATEIEIVGLNLNAARPVPEDDVAPARPQKPFSKTGDVWICGRHRVACGDSTFADNLFDLVDGKSIDICFTSPPYGVSKSAGVREKYKPGQKRMKSLYTGHSDLQSDWPVLMRNWYAVAKKICNFTICNVQMLAENKVALIDFLHENKSDISDVAIWDKSTAAPPMQQNILSSAFEFMFLMSHNSQAAKRTIPFAKFHGDLSNIVRISSKDSDGYPKPEHRAMMPVALAHWVLGKLCSESKTVYDPFLGSGTTMIAAESLDKACFGMEIDPGYVDVSVLRWQERTGKIAYHAKTGAAFGHAVVKKGRKKNVE